MWRVYMHLSNPPPAGELLSSFFFVCLRGNMHAFCIIWVTLQKLLKVAKYIF